MKCFFGIFALSAFCVVAFASPIPNGMIFYQAPAYYPGFAQSARHTMLVRLEPYTAEGSVEEGEVSAFASGDHIAANTYLRGSAQKQVEGEQVVSEAEAFPAESDAPTQFEAPDSDRTPKEYPGVVSTGEEVPAFDNVIPVGEQEAAVADEGAAADGAADEAAAVADLPASDFAAADAPAEAAPIVPAAVAPKVVKSKNKVRTQLAAIDDDAEDDFVPFHKKRQQPARNGGDQAAPANTFFPVNFGSTNGGAIAIANSFSTGKGGSATSHAIAYGSPAKTKTKSV